MKSIPYSSYFDETVNVIQFLQSPDLAKVLELYKILDSKEKIQEYVKKKQEGWLDKFKTTEEVQKYIFSLKKSLEKQELVIGELSRRNEQMAQFIIAHSLGDKIKTSDLLELTDWYKESMESLQIKIGVKSVEESVNRDEIDNAIKLLKEPHYEEYDGYNSDNF